MRREVWAWVLAFALTLLVGFGVGWWLGNDTDAERATWDAQVRERLTTIRAEHDSLRAIDAAAVEAAGVRALQAIQAADRERRQRDAAIQRAHTTQAQLDAARARNDTLTQLALYPTLVTDLTDRATAAERETTKLRAVVAEQAQQLARLRAMAAKDSTLAARDDQLLGGVPEPKRTLPVFGIQEAVTDMALAAATARACEASILSFGCVAGGTVTVVRVVNRLR